MVVTDGTTRARILLAVDLTALLLFVVVGTLNHDASDMLEAVLRDAVAFGAPWILASVGFRTYRPPAHATLAKTVVVSIVVGAIVRTLWVGSPTGGRLLVFIGVALVFVTLFVGTGRALASLGSRALRRTA